MQTALKHGIGNQGSMLTRWPDLRSVGMWALGQAGQGGGSILCARIPFCGLLLYTPGPSVVPHFKTLFFQFHDPSRCLTGYKIRTSYPFQSTWQCMCVCAHVCVFVCHCLVWAHVYVGSCRNQKKASDPMEQGLQAFVSCLTWLLISKLLSV